MSIGAKQGAPTIRNLSRKRMFELLDAPLKNHVWSWGARSELSGRVYLAVWNHEIDTVKGRVLVTDGPEPIYGHGDRERHGHLRVIQQGAEAFGVILTAKDSRADRLTYKSVNTTELIVFGRLIQEPGGRWWLEDRGRCDAASHFGARL